MNNNAKILSHILELLENDGMINLITGTGDFDSYIVSAKDDKDKTEYRITVRKEEDFIDN